MYDAMKDSIRDACRRNDSSSVGDAIHSQVYRRDVNGLQGQLDALDAAVTTLEDLNCSHMLPDVAMRFSNILTRRVIEVQREMMTQVSSES